MTDQELNEAVARKLARDCHFCSERKPNHHHLWGASVGGQKTVIDPVPDYCHSIQAAWKIAENLRTRYEVNLTSTKQNWHVWITGPTWKQGQHVEADTAPKAICLAFLKLEDK